HALGINHELVDQVRRLVQHVIRQDRRIRKDHALDRRMRDIAFMPQRNILKSRLRVRTNDTGQTADLFTLNRVTFMWHRRRALLLFAEELLRLAYLCPLKVANLRRDLVERARDDSKRRQVERVAVALNHLRRHGCHVQAQAFANSLFVLGLEVRGVADGSAQFAYSHVFSSMFEPLKVALHLGIPIRQLQSKRDRLSMDSMRSPDLRSVLKLERPPLQHFDQTLEVVSD